jgi:N-dimethylarginine dimethylaminohydrolase
VSWRRRVLMGDPDHFSVKGGANPHTRTWLGTRRSVDRATAIAQWQRLRDLLRDLGVRVVVVPADPGQPGLVYPANAGFLPFVDAEKPIFDRTFHLSNLIATRAGERFHYARVVTSQGLRVAAIPERLRFEGEADFFPVGDAYVLTHGRLENQRWVPRIGIPPWKRVYGFRTDARVLSFLEPLVAPREIVRVELVLEAHYHGDTALCAFGVRREHLLVWRPALAPESFEHLRAKFGDALIELSDDDAAHYAANSFALPGPDPVLVLPAGVSDRLLAQVRGCGVRPLTVDVGEFLKKGGGSVKCMIGDLGLFEVP